MHQTPRRRRWPTIAVTAGAIVLAGTLAACGSGGSSGSGGSGGGSTGGATTIAQALQQPTTLTFWTWAGQDKLVAQAFEKKYPKIKINIVDEGTSAAEYTKLENAIKAGSGIPDLAQIEYFALPQFALQGDLADLTKDGINAASAQSQFSTAVWNSVYVSGHLYGLPQDTGPMALFYNKTIFDKYHLAVPTTWAQFAAEAATLHADSSKEYLTSDDGDAGFTTSMIWDAGGHPFTTNGTKNVTINLQDPGTLKWTSLWTPLIDKGLLDPLTPWTTQWYQGLANGTVASLVTGGWMVDSIQSGVPSGNGDWRVAPMPEWTAGQPTTAENGGSSNAVLAASKNQLAAAGFLEYLSLQQGAQISADQGDFPALNSILDSSSYLDQSPAYFGGQKVYQVLSQAASQVLPGWSYLPYEVYANSVYPDTVGQVYASKSTLNSGLTQWQQRLVSYGSQEGFSVVSK
jgi:multiple sugar transport system substrate-binding protein